jgi:hypothetical protein
MIACRGGGCQQRVLDPQAMKSWRTRDGES